MAADQHKKRLNATSLVGCTSREQYRVKRKKLQVKHHGLNMRPTISLEWDNKKKSVVSKKDQIGIKQRHMLPFIEPGAHSHNILADVFPVPQEIFELENLSKVLSYEVWQRYLSDNERSFLSQFLPKGSESDTIVRDLLAGDSFHFGNPFVKWGASICVGELHPDNILQEEVSLKAGKKAYCSDLHKYHNDMIMNLQTWKEKWASCKDPEMDIVQDIWSSWKHAESTVPPETRFCGTEENLVATPESCSWANSDAADSSDNQNLGTVHGQSQRRKEFWKKLSDNCSSGLNVVAAVSRKGEKLHKRNIQHSDGAKYMSYIKVSREQHERFKSSMKHSGNSSQPRALNNVLGVIDALNVQPFERFEEEERKKLHEHWLKLATKDILEGFVNWRKRQLQRKELIWSMVEEIGQKMEGHENTLGEDEEGSQNKRTELSDDGIEEILPLITTEGGQREHSDALLQEQMGNEGAHEIETETETEDEKDMKSDYIYEERTTDDTELFEDEGAAPNQVIIRDENQQHIVSLNNSPRSTTITSPSSGFLHDQHQKRLNSNLQSNSIEMESHNNNASGKTDEDTPIESEYSGNLNRVDIHVSQGTPLPSSCDIWPLSDVHDSYYQSTATNARYASAQELSIRNPQFIQEQAVQLLDMETGRQDKSTGKDFLHSRQSDDMSFFSSYPNQERNELLHSFFKDQGNPPYHHQQKHLGLEFQAGNEVMMEGAGQFSGHFREQVHPSLAPPHKSLLNDIYMHQNIHINESMYPGGRFVMSRQEELPVNIHDWATSVRMPIPSVQSQLSQNNWYAGGENGWPLQVANHNNNSMMGSSRGRNLDQSLFSVLTECNELAPRANYEAAMGPAERLIQAGNYNYSGGGIPSSSSSNFLQQPTQHSSLNYFNGGHEVGGGIKMNNLGWMGLSQQNSGLQQHDSISKPFLRSWNQ
ncbi:hypothetical protein ABFS82_06G000900 [Erythranthe guttata]|uniref:uncharacterized protein LOC105964104 n=1 Tax=Erythranthe guttata TaxID=4155 RepID=UPI00064DD790|nr:PREDICTED: uncharacterized protein LOC105964104 [Erythranthe guttata]|eukprot:XP_012844061.1 PREDICTED: uncharacterized protein LOC105964104 [Erythranthe guttata]